MSSVVIAGNTSGSVTLDAPAVAGTTVLTLPATSGTIVTTATSTGISGSAITTGTVGVSVGGTGVNTTTAYGVLAGGTTSTGAFQNIGTGTSTQVLTSNGPGLLPTFQALPASGGQLQTQLFTAPGTWTKPASCTQVRVTVVGGGGGYLNTYGTVGGMAGAAQAIVPVSAPVAITVGAGAGTNASGGASSFGSAVSATGGPVGSAGPGFIAGPGSGTVSTGTALRTGGIYQSAPSPTLLATQRDVVICQIGILSGRLYNNSSPGVQTYTTSGAFMAGAAMTNQNSYGGVGGAVVVEYVG